MTFPAYPEYRESGISAMGNIPRHWAVISFKRAATISYGLGQPPEYHLDGTRFLRATNVKRGELSTEGLVYVDEAALPESRVTRLALGDIVVVRSGAYTGDSAIVTADWVGAIAGFDMAVRMKPGIAPAFAAAALLSKYMLEAQINLLRLRAAQPHLNAEELGNLLFVLPPPAEQSAIAAFLDRETGKIDALVAEQERLIALLKEKRQAVISQAVTKGLDPNVPMKDSGVEWLGEVPAHWEVKRLKHLILPGTSISYGIVQPGDAQDEGVPFIQTSNMTSASFDLDSLQKTTAEIAAAYPRTCLEGGEVILGIRASIGSCHVVHKELHGVNLSRGVARIVSNGTVTSEFLVAFLRSKSATEYWALMRQGSTFNEVSIETVKEITIPMPPVGEQTAIIAFLTEASSIVDALTAEAERAVTLFRERRAALISAAVTGKIDVRDLAAEHPAEAA